MVHPELEPSLVETVIGEDDETSLKSSSSEKKLVLTSKPLQRSLSDRYSYRAAIYQNENPEFDII